MPRSADPTIREALVAAGTRLVTAEGSGALSTRRVAAEVGTSAIAVYTYLGGMPQLRAAIRRAGLAGLTAELDAPTPSDDPVADLVTAALTYFSCGLAAPELYRFMLVDPPPSDPDGDPGTGLFDRLRAAVERCVDAGRFQAVEPTLLAGWAAEVWLTCHGMVTFALTGTLPRDQVRFLLTDMIYRLIIGFGDDPATAGHSIQQATNRSLPDRDGHDHQKRSVARTDRGRARRRARPPADAAPRDRRPGTLDGTATSPPG